MGGAGRVALLLLLACKGMQQGCSATKRVLRALGVLLHRLLLNSSAMRGVCHPALGPWRFGVRGHCGTHRSVLSACRLLLRAVSCPSGCVRFATACGAAAERHTIAQQRQRGQDVFVLLLVSLQGNARSSMGLAHQLFWRGLHGCQVVDGVLQAAAVVASATGLLLPALLPLLLPGKRVAAQAAGLQPARVS
jgi:hypothetical protein